MELRIKASDKNSQELEELLQTHKVAFQRMEHGGVDAGQAVEFVLTWGPPVLNLIGAIVDLAKKVGKDKAAKITIDLSDD
jgi:hypothetical protein